MKNFLEALALFVPRLLFGAFSTGRAVLNSAPPAFQLKAIGLCAKQTPFVRLSTLDNKNTLYFYGDPLPLDQDEILTVRKSFTLAGILDPYLNFVTEANSGEKIIRFVVDDPTKLINWFKKS